MIETLIVTAVWMFFALIVGLIIYAIWKTNKNRIEGVRKYAEKNNYKLFLNMPVDSIKTFPHKTFTERKRLMSFSTQTEKLNYLLQCKKEGYNCTIAEYLYGQRSGDRNTTVAQTLYIIDLKKPAPAFSLEPNSAFKKATAYFKQGYHVHPDDDEFNKLYLFSADNDKRFFEYFSEHVRAYFKKNPLDIIVCSDRKRLLFFKPGTYHKADQLDAELEKALHYVKVLD